MIAAAEMLGRPAPIPAVLVGRAHERTRLREVLAALLAGSGGLVLVGGGMGVGKTALINSFMATLDPEEFFVIQVSATSGEFAGPPSFDAVLDIMCRRLVASPPSGQRPATLATLAAAVGALTREGRTVLLAIDQADHLTNNVIAETTRLRKYLAADEVSFVCLFIGSPTLASRHCPPRRSR